MGMFKQRIEIDSYYGYQISNADVDWESMPQKANFECPGLQIDYNAEEIKDQKVSIDDYVKLSNFGHISPEFELNYVKALHGELDEWRLIAVKINKGCRATFAFINEKTWQEEDLYLEKPPRLDIVIKKQLTDGSIDKFLLTLWSQDNQSVDWTSITEYGVHGEKRIIKLEQPYRGAPECPDKGWDYAYIL